MLRTTIHTIVLLLLAHLGQAQTSFSTLEDIWQYADEHNVTIRNTAYELSKAMAGRKQSYMALLPQASATASFTDNLSLQTTLVPALIFGGPADVYVPVQFGQKYIYAAGFTAQLDVVNLQTWYNLRVAKETEEMNRDSLASTRKTIYQQIAIQYYSYLLNKEALRIAQQSSAVADSVYTSVNNKFTEGTLNLANMDVAKLNSEKAQQTYINASYQLQTTTNTLRALLGLSVGDPLTINASLQSDMVATPDGPFSEDPAIKLANSKAHVGLSMYRASNMAYFPTLSVAYSNTTQQNDNKFQPFEAGGPSWYPAQYWSLRASWTIFNGGNRWLQSQKNKFSYYQSRMQYEQAQRQSAINDENLRLTFRKASELYKRSQSIMNLSFDNYQHITNRYNEGLASLDDRLNAFTDYINYQNQYLNSLSELLVQLYQVKLRQRQF